MLCASLKVGIHQTYFSLHPTTAAQSLGWCSVGGGVASPSQRDCGSWETGVHVLCAVRVKSDSRPAGVFYSRCAYQQSLPRCVMLRCSSDRLRRIYRGRHPHSCGAGIPWPLCLAHLDRLALSPRLGTVSLPQSCCRWVRSSRRQLHSFQRCFLSPP